MKRRPINPPFPRYLIPRGTLVRTVRESYRGEPHLHATREPLWFECVDRRPYASFPTGMTFRKKVGIHVWLINVDATQVVNRNYAQIYVIGFFLSKRWGDSIEIDVNRFGDADNAFSLDRTRSLLEVGHGDRIVVERPGGPVEVKIGKVSPIFTDHDLDRDRHIGVSTGRKYLDQQNYFRKLKPLAELNDDDYAGIV